MNNKGNMISTMVLSLVMASCCTGKTASEKGLKDIFQKQFYIGTAINQSQILKMNAQEDKIIRTNFNSIVAENCMKCESIHPQENVYDFSLSDKFVKYGIKNKMFIIGHTLIWHSQLAPWFTVDKNGKEVSRNVLIQRMRDHIHTIVSRYKGKVKGWDVVNEAIEDNGELRKSKFLKIIGPEYLELAFTFAHEADPDAELYYNDYSMSIPAKRNRVVEMINDFKSKGIRIDGVGMQSHLSMDKPAVEDYEKSLKAFIQAGVDVNITELDLSVLPWPDDTTTADISTNYAFQEKLNPYTGGLPEEISNQWEKRMMQFFDIYDKYHSHVKRVTLWGVADSDSWRNDWPIKGRKDYPLLFDAELQPKSIIKTFMEKMKN